MLKTKRKKRIIPVIVLALLTITIAACGKSEFKVDGNTEKQMTITARNAEKDAFFMVGSLEADDGEQIVITSGLDKGSIKVEIVKQTETESAERLPDLDGEAVITGNVVRTDVVSGTIPAGSYLLRATCLEKATGTVQIEVKPV